MQGWRMGVLFWESTTPCHQLKIKDAKRVPTFSWHSIEFQTLRSYGPEEKRVQVTKVKLGNNISSDLSLLALLPPLSSIPYSYKIWHGERLNSENRHKLELAIYPHPSSRLLPQPAAWIRWAEKGDKWRHWPSKPPFSIVSRDGISTHESCDGGRSHWLLEDSLTTRPILAEKKDFQGRRAE